jgi:hypothetical protein
MRTSCKTILLAVVVACGPPGRARSDSQAALDTNAGDGDDAGNAGPPCSADLHDVLDPMTGNVISTCPDDQGCAAGVCVPACQAAAASQGSVGCDFWVATPSTYVPVRPPCFAVFLANNWARDAAVTISRGSSTYDPATYGRVPDGTAAAANWPAIPSAGIASSQVGVLFLSDDPRSFNSGHSLKCPITPAVSVAGGTAVWTGHDAATGLGTAFHITTSVPVSAYDVAPFGGALSYFPSAELVLPTSAWGTNYITAGPNEGMGPGFGTVLAAQDNTHVQISARFDLPGGPGVAPAPAHIPTDYMLNAGQYLQWQNAGDMAGSILYSDKPIAFTGGTDLLCTLSATSYGGACDSAHQQIPPLFALASEYVAPPYATRRRDLQPESIPYRIVGAVAGTAFTFSPPIAGGPTTLDAGQVAEFQTTEPFIVKTQDAMHPFYIGQYMSGCEVESGSRAGGAGCLGDPEFVNIVPPEQWLSSYVFFTDPSYKVTNLVFARRADAAGTFHDVTVDCLGTLAGWQPVGDGTKYQVTNADIQRVTPVGSCKNGRHTAQSGGAFTIMVWGLGWVASYAYPAGGNVAKINSVVVIP